MSTRENSLPIKLNREELKNVDHFTYLGSVIDNDGTIDRDVDLRGQAAWSSWRKLTGVLYDRKVPLRLKSKVYEAIIRSALAYGSECWAMKVTNKRMNATTEMRMLLAGSSECRDEVTCETKTFDAYYTFHRLTMLCAVDVFVGLDMSRDETQPTSPAV